MFATTFLGKLTILDWMSKVMCNSFDFALPPSVVGLENLGHALHQSDTKQKPIVTWSPAFSCAFGNLLLLV